MLIKWEEIKGGNKEQASYSLAFQLMVEFITECECCSSEWEKQDYENQVDNEGTSVQKLLVEKKYGKKKAVREMKSL